MAYVPLKDYGYGKLMDDYVFLEDGKRKAEQWGKEIVGLKMEHREESSVKPLPAKSLALKKALSEREIQVDFLPDGMERRRKNQSHYNQKYVSFTPTNYPILMHTMSQKPTRPTLHGIQIRFPALPIR